MLIPLGFLASSGSRFSYVGVSHAVTPFVTIYPFLAGFEAKYANPVTLPTGAGRSIAFSPTSADVIIGHDTTPFVSAYPFDLGFGTRYANPASLPPAV